MLWNRKKKEEPVQEKKTVSVSEMKIKYKMFDNKVKDYIKRNQAVVDKHIQKATELRLRGLDAGEEIKRIAFFQNKIRIAEKRSATLEKQLESYEIMMIDKEFLSEIAGMVEALGGYDIDSSEIEEVSKKVMDANLKLATQQEMLNTKMEELNGAFDSMDSLSGMDGYEEANNNINAIIDQAISDAKFSNVSTETISAQDIARSVSDKIKLDA